MVGEKEADASLEDGKGHKRGSGDPHMHPATSSHHTESSRRSSVAPAEFECHTTLYALQSISQDQL